ncbi:MAG: hypothetical protein ACREOO_25220 [bacterium]
MTRRWALHRSIKAVHPILGTWEKQASIEPDQEAFVEIDFNKQLKLTVTAFDESGVRLYATIFVDDKNTSQTTPKQLSLPLGLHKIEVRLDGYGILEGAKTILLESDWKEPLRFTLRKNP